MIKRRLLAVLLTVLVAGSLSTAAAPEGPVVRLIVDGPIGPATSDYVVQGMDEAAAADARAVLLELDTPGGLDAAMREIVQAIINSPVPVIGYVAPSGARAASAGTYILYATHVAAMAPGTNLGAATPVRVGGDSDGGPLGSGGDAPKEQEDESAGKGGGAMERKMVNDAVAYIRSLAEMRGRNADWAEKAVREAASLSAEAAVAENVIDLVAPSRTELLQAVDGRKVELSAGSVTLATADAEVRDEPMDWRQKLLAVLTNPNVAYILMLIGMYGLIFELANPGAAVPGVVGAIALLLALFAFQALPVNYAGLALIALGVLFMIAEAFVPSFGALGLGGVVAFAVGSVLLLDTESPEYQISAYVIGGFTLASALIFLGIAGLAVRAHGRPVVTGRQEMVGSIGVAATDFPGAGRIRIHGELWSAECDQPVAAGSPVRVVAMDGLKLKIEPHANGD